MTSFQVGHGLAFLTVLLSLSAASIGQNQSEAQSPVPGSAIHVTQVLGIEGAKHNATGELKIQDGVMQFQRDGSTTRTGEHKFYSRHLCRGRRQAGRRHGYDAG